MLMTYHAFANVVLFHRACRAHGFRDAAADAREAEFSGQLAQYEQVLAASKCLTPIGRALWEPLAELVHSSAMPATLSNTHPQGDRHVVEKAHTE